MVTYLASHALSIATVVAWFVMLSRIAGSRRTSQSSIAWLLAFAFLPVIAIPLYLALGTRKLPRRAKGGAMAVPPARSGNAFEILATGEAAYARLLALIGGARRTIDLTTFILGDDATGRAVVEALAERARHGVDVRVILDAVGCARTFRGAEKALRAAGAEVRAFMPFWHSPLRGKTNLRSHRKLVVVDGEHVMAGGMNLAREYMGTPLPEGEEPRWRDVAAVASGPVAADAAALFESDWAFCGGAARTSSAGAPAAAGEPRGDARVQLVPSGPDMLGDTIYDLFLNGIFRAEERILIVTPYYVPDEALQHALVLAARRGVRTLVLVPARSNHRIADVARRKLLRELRAEGVVVHFYARGMVHAKAMVVDDAFAYVGSPNFDMRSLFLNYEDALFVRSPEAIGQVRGYVEGLVAECPADPPAEPERRILEQIALLVAPEF
jgi:cardiolipin synthase